MSDAYPNAPNAYFDSDTKKNEEQPTANVNTMTRVFSKSLFWSSVSGVRDWNNEFQTLLDIINDDSILQFENEFQALADLAEDFVFTATALGKIIISEKYIEEHTKTIKPIHIGGIAGGEKYLIHNIVFKFAIDDRGIYGSDLTAAKVAGLELLGVIHAEMASVPGLHVPLCCLIDYKGSRLVAMSRLPIDKGKTLVYGSCDGGFNVVNQSKDFEAIMSQLAKQLNLAPHEVTPINADPAQSVKVCGPFDLEGHLGHDSKLYAVDFARLFPPVPVFQRNVELNKNSHMYLLFRPEFVKSLDFPLCCDVYLKILMDPDNLHRTNIERAYTILLQKQLPSFAAVLNSIVEDSDEQKEIVQFFSSHIHRHGINLRYVGHLRKLVSNPFWKKFLLLEAIARTLKNQMRMEWQIQMSKTRFISDQPFRQASVYIMNLCFGKSKSSSRYWRDIIQNRLQESFECILDIEQDSTPDLFVLRRSLSTQDMKVIFDRFIVLSGIEVEPAYQTASQEDTSLQIFGLREPFHVSDVKEIIPKVKQMPLASYAQGTSLFIRASSLHDKGKIDEARRLAMRTKEKFDEVLMQNMNDYRTLCNVGFLFEKIFDDTKKSMVYYQKALQANPSHVRSWYYLGFRFLYKEKDFLNADKCLWNALKLSNLTHANAWKELGVLKEKTKQRVEAEPFYRKSLEQSPDLVSACTILAEFLMSDHKTTCFDEVTSLLSTAASSVNGGYKVRQKARRLYTYLLLTRAEYFLTRTEFLDEALLTVDILLDIDPQNVDALLLKCKILVKMENLTASLISDIHKLYSRAIRYGAIQYPGNVGFKLAYAAFLRTSSLNEIEASIKIESEIESTAQGVFQRAAVGLFRAMFVGDPLYLTNLLTEVNSSFVFSLPLLRDFQKYCKDAKDVLVSQIPRASRFEKSSRHVCARMLDSLPCICSENSHGFTFICRRVVTPFVNRFTEQGKLPSHSQAIEIYKMDLQEDEDNDEEDGLPDEKFEESDQPSPILFRQGSSTNSDSSIPPKALMLSHSSSAEETVRMDEILDSFQHRIDLSHNALVLGKQ
jgi:tetratricopeptide (TPR) repeat protein